MFLHKESMGSHISEFSNVYRIYICQIYNRNTDVKVIDNILNQVQLQDKIIEHFHLQSALQILNINTWK